MRRKWELTMRTAGASYQEIKAAGGGILSSIGAVRQQAPKAMAAQLAGRAARFLECGTTTAEVKSGYGLSIESELKMLRAVRAARKLASNRPLTVRLAREFGVPDEELVHVRASGATPGADLRRWCSKLPPRLREKLAEFDQPEDGKKAAAPTP